MLSPNTESTSSRDENNTIMTEETSFLTPLAAKAAVFERHSSSDDDGEEADLSVDKLSRMMREQDADLLESMHYASSQVSQYSPGGTPILRPKDRSLPIEDVPLMLMPLSLTSQLLGDESSQKEARTTSFVADEERMPSRPSLGETTEDQKKKNRRDSTGVESSDSIHADSHYDDNSRTADGRFRRLLSGEIRTVSEAAASGNGDEEETTASPVSVAQEATAAALQTGKESGLAQQRRVSEALQFAQAVGEEISINRDALCIIEDHTDDGESCDSDDDEACESKEIHVSDMASMGEVSQSQAKEEQETAQPALPSHVDVRPTPDMLRRKLKRPVWPFGPDQYRFLDHLSSDGIGETNNFVYKGICANPPEITKRGIQRGNYAQLHRKAWLEVSDKYHRYGKNLRLYYRYWEKLDFPTNKFFDWLDSKGEAAGQPLPNLDECPRSVLDSDTVLYITNPEVTEGYALEIIPNHEDGRGRVIDVDGAPVSTGSDGWIFVLRDGVMYGNQKITSISGHSKQRFHHSSFFGGKAVASAGIILTDSDGYITRLYPHSGHYRPSEAHMQRMLFFLHRRGVDLRTFEMDTQQFRHVSREKDHGKHSHHNNNYANNNSHHGGGGEKKMKKVDSLHLEKGANVACFLAHKAGFIGHGIFDKIHKIRKADVTTVSEALEIVDLGGYRSSGMAGRTGSE